MAEIKKKKRTNFFDYNLTDHPDYVLPEAKGYVIRTVSPSLHERMKSVRGMIGGLEKEAKLPPVANALRWTCYLAVILALGNLIIDDYGFCEGMKIAPLWYLVGLTALLVWWGIWVYDKRRGKSFAEDERIDKVASQSENIEEEILADLQIPEGAVELDIFTGEYIMKNGKRKNANEKSEIVNRVYRFWRDGNKLCIADLESVVSIPLTDFGKVWKVEDKKPLMSWNKADNPSDRKYTRYGISFSVGVMFTEWHYAFEVGEDFEIRIPGYDGAAVMNYIGYVPPQIKEPKGGLFNHGSFHR